MVSKEHQGTIVGGIAVVIGAVALIGLLASGPAQSPDVNVYPEIRVEVPEAAVGGQRGGSQEFLDGATLGDATIQWQTGNIAAGSNQGAWCNNQVGKTVYVDRAEMRAVSGTASSSVLLYTSTSTATTVADFSPPMAWWRMIDGATFATSTLASQLWTVSTSSSNGGKGMVALAARECIVFNVQERYACKSVGQCETATSSNRGISSYDWALRIHY